MDFGPVDLKDGLKSIRQGLQLMMGPIRSPLRRAVFLASILVALVGVQSLWSAQPQQAPVNRNRMALPQQNLVPQAEAKEDRAFTSSVKLPLDPRAKRKIDLAKQYAKSQDWTQAIKLLQSLLDGKEDTFLQEHEGKSRRPSVRAEANRLLGSLPKEGLQFYEQEYGAPARLLLKQGQATGDPQIYAEVALRYLHTEAGAEAAALLGAYHLDEGQYITAALCFERLQNRSGGLNSLSPLLLFKAALAFERSGDAVGRDRALTLLESKRDQPGEAPLPPSLAKLRGAALRAALEDRSELRLAAASNNWPMFLGSPDRTALGIGSVPYLEPRIGYPLDATRSLRALGGPPEAARSLLEQALRKQAAMNWPLIPGSHPIAVGELLIYRSAWGVHAVNVKSGKLEWESSSKVSLASMASPRSGLQDNSEVSNWLSFYRDQFPWLYFDNSMIGTLSTDQSLVYAIEDLAVPPNDVGFRGGFPNQGGRGGRGEVGKWRLHNKLVAYDLSREGMIAWELGSADGGTPFDETFFLGCPLPLGDKLYTLAENNQEIRLLCLQSQKTWNAEAGRFKRSVELVWSQALCQPFTRIDAQPLRRTQAVQLAYSDGILVCPTHAGVVIGVDLLTRSLVWAHAYQIQDNVNGPDPEGNFVPLFGQNRRFAQVGGGPLGMGSASFGKPGWSVAAPMIAGGLVLFTAPDGQFLHALSLKDGVEVWRHELKRDPKAADLYLGGIVAGKALIVGQASVRALDLKSGRLAWTLPIATPNGRGVASDAAYYLPVRTGDLKNLDGGEVWAIDVAAGKVTSRSRSKAEAPGNLIFHDGELISQSPLKVVVYPQLSAKEGEITARLEKNPRDPSGLAQRGEMRLYRGDLANASADLRQALAQADIPPAERQRAREKLFEALCETLDKDFGKHEADVQDLARLVEIEPAGAESEEARRKRLDEQLDRKARYLRLIAKGRQGQGKLKEALSAYLEFAGLGGQLIGSPEDPTLLVEPIVWAQGRVEALMKSAAAGQKKELETAFEAEWQAARKASEVETLRRFARFYEPICAQGREARLELAERLMAEKSDKSLVEATIWLQKAMTDADPQRSARAYEARARLDVSLGQLNNAAYHYRLLAQKHPKVVVRDGKTGEQLYLELATDKRFLPYLSSLEIARGGLLGQSYQRIERLEPRQSGDRGNGRALVWLEPDGDLPPLFDGIRIGVDAGRRQVRIVDRATEEDRGSFTLQGWPISYSPQARPTASYRAFGSIAVFAWGNVVYAYDVAGARLLWSHDLLNGYEAAGAPYGGYPQANLMPAANGRFELLNANNNSKEWVGMLGLADAAGVCFTVRDRGMVMVDPLTGKERWVKSDVPTSMELFGDGAHVFLAPPRTERKNRRQTAVRALDGVSVVVPDFLRQYDARLRLVDGKILLKESGDDENVLRLFDPAQGLDVWSLPLGKDGLALHSLDPAVAGGVDKEGKLTIVDALSGRPLLRARLEPLGTRDFDSKQPLHLIGDAQSWFVFSNERPEMPKDAGKETLKRASPQQAQQDLRTVDVCGPAYCFDRQTGLPRWKTQLPLQALVTEQFEDTPMVLFACNLNLIVTNERIRGVRYFSRVMALDKRDGTEIGDRYDRDNNPYVDLRVDPAAGLVELIGQSHRIGYQLVGDSAAR